jgi:hypothetical protein
MLIHLFKLINVIGLKLLGNLFVHYYIVD